MVYKYVTYTSTHTRLRHRIGFRPENCIRYTRYLRYARYARHMRFQESRRVGFVWKGGSPLGFRNLFRRSALSAKLNLCVVCQSLTNGSAPLARPPIPLITARPPIKPREAANAIATLPPLSLGIVGGRYALARRRCASLARVLCASSLCVAHLRAHTALCPTVGLKSPLHNSYSPRRSG